MEGEGFTDPEFLDDPEALVRDSVRESFSWWRPKKCLLLDPTPCISDLVTHRWYGAPGPAEQILSLRRIQLADICGPLRSSFLGFEDFAKLLAAYHGKVKQVANGHTPRYWRRRQAPKDKHTRCFTRTSLPPA